MRIVGRLPWTAEVERCERPDGWAWSKNLAMCGSSLPGAPGDPTSDQAQQNLADLEVAKRNQVSREGAAMTETTPSPLNNVITIDDKRIPLAQIWAGRRSVNDRPYRTISWKLRPAALEPR